MAGEHRKQKELDAASCAASMEAHRLGVAYRATRNAAPEVRAAAREALDSAVIRALVANRDSSAFRAAQAVKRAKFAEEALQEVLARHEKERAERAASGATAE